MKFRKVLATAGVVSLASIGNAVADGGYIGGSYSNTELEVGDADSSGDSYGVEGAVAFGGVDSLGVQVNGAFNRVELDDIENELDTWGADAHLFLRNSAFAVGGLVGASKVDIDEDDLTAYRIGGEAQGYFDRLTLAGDVVYNTLDEDDADGDLYELAAELRFFPADNFQINAGGSFATAEFDDIDEESNLYTLGVSAEYMLAAAPISFFGGYERFEAEDFDDAGADIFSVGVRYSFGGSLFERDRTGAGMGRKAVRGVLASLGPVLGAALDDSAT